MVSGLESLTETKLSSVQNGSTICLSNDDIFIMVRVYSKKTSGEQTLITITAEQAE